MCRINLEKEVWKDTHKTTECQYSIVRKKLRGNVHFMHCDKF